MEALYIQKRENSEWNKEMAEELNSYFASVFTKTWIMCVLWSYQMLRGESRRMELRNLSAIIEWWSGLDGPNGLISAPMTYVPEVLRETSFSEELKEISVSREMVLGKGR